MSHVLRGICLTTAILGQTPCRSAEEGASETVKATATTPPGSPLTAEVLQKSAEDLEKEYEGRTPPEAIRMLIAIRKGSMMGPGEGWFGPAQSRYSWEWLAKRQGIDPKEAVTKEAFQGPERLFAVLDRNRDGRIAAGDFDWADNNPWVQQSYQIHRYFRRIDTKGDGRATREEWIEFFDRARRDQEHLTAENLRDAFIGGVSGGFLPGDAPTPDILLKGLAAGEVGSPLEGPAIGDAAPDFTLKSSDGEVTVRLADVLGKKPVVLVFGNYTCGPFRTLYQGVEDVHGRFHGDADFLAVYVREAHPTDGWKMKSNEMVGVAVAQPKSYDERVAVASQCRKLLKTSMPLLVDDISDTTGHTYSGMPARLYVIDREGKVAYKSGRGPFGFKTGEMEQALVMSLLESEGSK